MKKCGLEVALVSGLWINSNMKLVKMSHLEDVLTIFKELDLTRAADQGDQMLPPPHKRKEL